MIPIQLVFWWRTWRIGRGSPVPSSGPHKGSVYRWRFQVGPVEVRRWGNWRELEGE